MENQHLFVVNWLNLHLTTFNIIQVRLLLKVVSRINLSTTNELCHGCNSKAILFSFLAFCPHSTALLLSNNNNSLFIIPSHQHSYVIVF